MASKTEKTAEISRNRRTPPSPTGICPALQTRIGTRNFLVIWTSLQYRCDPRISFLFFNLIGDIIPIFFYYIFNLNYAKIIIYTTIILHFRRHFSHLIFYAVNFIHFNVKRRQINFTYVYLESISGRWWSVVQSSTFMLARCDYSQRCCYQLLARY